MTCPRCGRQNPEESRFCSDCGAELSAPQTALGAPPTIPAPPPPAPGPTIGALASSGWDTAARLGSWAFLAVALTGQTLAWILFGATRAAGDQPLGVVNTLRIGGFYFFTFHHVGISFSGDVGGGVVPGSVGGRFEFGFALSLLLVTWVAGFLLFLFGRRVANGVGGEQWARAIHGAKVAVPYAAFSLILSFVLPFSIATGTAGSSVHVGVGHVGAFVLPFLLGIVAGGLGGLRSGPAALDASAWGRRAIDAVASGWRMFVYALVFGFVSLLVLAAINPRATTTVVRGETDRTGGYGFTMVNHVLALPNQSMWVLVPAMGGCDGAYGAGGAASVRFDALCYWHFPRTDRTTPIPGGTPFFGASTTQIGGTPSLPFGFGTAPAPYFLFLLLPAAAVLLGGWRAAGRLSAASPAEAALSGAMAGVVFGGLVGLGSWLGGVGVTGGGGFLGIDVRVSGAIGPRIGAGLLFGLLWGVVGGALGGLLHARRARARTAAPAAAEPAVPPSPP